MLKKLLVALTASAFAMGTYAQAQKAEPATPPGASAKGDAKGQAKVGGEKKAKRKVAKAKTTRNEGKKDGK